MAAKLFLQIRNRTLSATEIGEIQSRTHFKAVGQPEQKHSSSQQKDKQRRKTFFGVETHFKQIGKKLRPPKPKSPAIKSLNGKSI